MAEKSLRGDTSAGVNASGAKSLRLKIVLGQAAALGPGKIGLLEAIGETGSISAAGRRFKMSYRRAWELVAELNGMFDAPLVIAGAGGVGGGGARLTPLGRDVARRFRAIEAAAWKAAEPGVRRLRRRLSRG
jgi:molybdate transport system regulatory protein